MKKAKEALKIEIDNEKIKKVVLYLLAFLLPLVLIIGIFIYLKIYPFGANTYLPVDAFGQYVNFLQYFRNVFTEGESVIYSFSKAIGGEMYGLFAYYLMSPYNFISLFFQKGNMTLVFDIILVLKMASCSLSFTYYLNRRKKANFTNLIFAMMYAFSGYVITYGFNIMWLDAVILLPLVVAGIDDLIEKKKCILYIITLTLTLITNYYIGFMVCIFSLLYYIYRTLIGDLKNKKEILKKTGIFSLASICTALIAGIVLVPVFIGLQDGRADFSFSDLNFDKNFEIQKLISKLFTNSFNFDEIQNIAMPPIFCGILANILVLVYFINSKIKLREKIFSLLFIVIFVLSFYIKGANILWSMGNIPAWYIYRYAFCFTFIYIIFAKKGFENARDGMKIWKWIVVAIIFTALAIFAMNLETNFSNLSDIKIDIVLGIIFILLLMLSKINFIDNGKKIKKFLSKYYTKIITFIILIISSVNLVYNATNNLRIIRENGSAVEQGIYGILINIFDRTTGTLKEHDSGIYRTENKTKITVNDALTFGYNSMTYSSSTYSKTVHSFLEKLGMTKNHVNIECNLENTEAVDMLLGVKYLIVPPGKEMYKNYELEYEELYIENNTKIYKNPYYLSFGYAVSEGIFNTNMENNNTFELQNEILKNMTGLNEDVYIKHNGELKEELQGMKKYENVKENFQGLDNIENMYEKIAEEGKIIFEFEVEKDDNIYICMQANTDKAVTLNISGEKNPRQISLKNNNMINLEKRRIGEKVTIEIVTEDNMNINDIQVYYEDEEVLKKHYDILSKTQVDLEKINNQKYEGKVKCDRKEYIIFTIPYDDGWKITVDGKEAKIKEVLGALMAVEVEEGEHEILLEYTLPGIKLGLALTFAGIIVFIVIIIMSKKNKNN